jgi:hypothetical protein
MQRKRKRVRPILLWLLAATIGVAVVWRVLVPALRSWQVERAIARCETNPSQDAADELTELLSRGIPSRQQGERMLKVLLHPRIITRPAYPVGVRPVVSAEGRLEVSFSHTRVSERVGLSVDGREGVGGWGTGGGHSFDMGPHFYSFYPEPQEPGVYQAEIRYECALTLMTQETSWSWNPLRGRLPWSLLPQKQVRAFTAHSAPDYMCRLNVPIELKVVKKDESEKIGFLSDTELDERMRSAFAPSPANLSGTYFTPAGKRSYTSGLEVKYTALPAAIAFTSTLRLANGDRVLPCEKYPGRHWARANASGAFWIRAPDFLLERTGEYTGTIILTPDPNYAYEDPAIKAIWNGTLEFPIRFTVSPEPDAK